MTGKLNMNGNKILVYREPTGDEDAATKKYVDDKDTSVDDKLNTLRAEYDVHVNMFLNTRRNFQKLNKIADDFFGSPMVVDAKLSEINIKLNDSASGIPNIVQKPNLIKIFHKQINNVIYTLSSGLSKWSQQNNTIKHIAEVTGVY